MTKTTDPYIASTTNWRKILKQNKRRTYFVITIFFLSYCALGLLVDMYLVASHYPQATISDLLKALLSFQILPIATLIMFTVAAISLFISYALYDKLMLLGTNYHEITPQTAKSDLERQLYNIVDELRIAAGLRFMPKVFIMDAEYMNAFASGYSEKSAMVAITKGLIEKLNRDELQAVMAHELTHIRHLDIKLTLTASLLANLMIMVLDFFFFRALFSGRNSDNSTKNSLTIIIIILRYLLPILSMLLLLYLSRTRELMADAGAVELTRVNQPLASALIKIQTDYEQHQKKYSAEIERTPNENVRRESYLFDPAQAGIRALSSLGDLFSTHPSLKTRLAALGFKLKK